MLSGVDCRGSQTVRRGLCSQRALGRLRDRGARNSRPTGSGCERRRHTTWPSSWKRGDLKNEANARGDALTLGMSGDPIGRLFPQRSTTSVNSCCSWGAAPARRTAPSSPWDACGESSVSRWILSGLGPGARARECPQNTPRSTVTAPAGAAPSLLDADAARPGIRPL